MNASSYLNTSKMYLHRNAPTIIVGLGAIGTVATAYLAAKAGYKTAEVIAEDRANRKMVRSRKEEFELVWKLYIPTVVVGTATIGSTLYANRLGVKRTAALAAAYAVSEITLDEYKNKVIEKIGKNKEKTVRDEIAQDRVTNQPIPDSQIIVTNDNEIICMDAYSGRYFKSSQEDLKKAQNQTNYENLAQGHVSLTYFYNCIGLDATAVSDDLGWSSDNQIELDFTTTLDNQGRPCLVFSFLTDPKPRFYRTY